MYKETAWQTIHTAQSHVFYANDMHAHSDRCFYTFLYSNNYVTGILYVFCVWMGVRMFSGRKSPSRKSWMKQKHAHGHHSGDWQMGPWICDLGSVDLQMKPQKKGNEWTGPQRNVMAGSMSY